MNRRKIEVEQLDPAGFTPEGYRAWAKANSIGHHVPLEEDAIFIIDGLWIYALTFPLKSWPTDPPIVEQGCPGRSKWRWYLLRTWPEAHGYIAPDTKEDA